MAEVDVTPYASVIYAYQSNPLYQWNGSTSLAADLPDSLIRLEGGGDARFVWSRQTFVADVAVRRFEYETHDYLSRTEEVLAGRYEWSPTPDAVAGASYRHEHRMVPFDELENVRELLMESENIAGVSLNLQWPDAWQLRSRLEFRDLASPRPEVPDLNLHETAVREELRRTRGHLSLGLDGEYLAGAYHGAGFPDARSYRQITLQVVGERTIAKFSTFSSALGFTTRDGPPGSDVTTLTGLIRYERNITGKTAGEVFLRRAVDDYLTGAGSEVNTDLGVRASWQPTVKARAEVSCAFRRTEPSGSPGSGVTSRRDRYEVITLQLRFQAFETLSVDPYARYATRSSTDPTLGFNAKEIGIELVFRESR